MNKYREVISDILHGRTLKEKLQERHDWEGPSAILHLYEKAATEGERTEFIDGVKQVISDENETQGVRAVLIQIAESQGISEVFPEVKDIKKKVQNFDIENPLHAAANNYLISQKLNSLIAF